MTHNIHTQQALANCKLGQLKKIAAELGIIPVENKTLNAKSTALKSWTMEYTTKT
jgi:hypothetical protein